jgi:NADH-quinone oxidoreductase subunit J
MTADIAFFIILAAVAVAAAVAMLLSKNGVYATLFLILNFSVIAVFYLMLDAPFIAMAQITVYAGAIMVLFLFVIMLLGAQQLRKPPTFKWQGPLAVFLAVVLLGSFGYMILSGAGVVPAAPAADPNFEGSPANIGGLLFNKYLLPFEVTSILLLVAMVGAIVLTMTGRRKA